jgi:hypothetical protein
LIEQQSGWAMAKAFEHSGQKFNLPALRRRHMSGPALSSKGIVLILFCDQ